MAVTYALGAEMLVLAGVARGHRCRARAMMEKAIGTGRAAEHFQKIIEAQGGNPGVVDDPGAAAAGGRGASCSPRRAAASSRASSRAPSGAASSRSAAAARTMEDIARSVGRLRHHGAPGRLGRAGRAARDDLRARSRRRREPAARRCARAITIADEADPPLPLVSHRVTSAGVELLVGT